MRRQLTLLTVLIFTVASFISMPGIAAEYDSYVDVAGNKISPKIEPLTEEEIQRNDEYDNMVEKNSCCI